MSAYKTTESLKRLRKNSVQCLNWFMNRFTMDEDESYWATAYPSSYIKSSINISDDDSIQELMNALKSDDMTMTPLHNVFEIKIHYLDDLSDYIYIRIGDRKIEKIFDAKRENFIPADVFNASAFDGCQKRALDFGEDGTIVLVLSDSDDCQDAIFFIIDNTIKIIILLDESRKKELKDMIWKLDEKCPAKGFVLRDTPVIKVL